MKMEEYDNSPEPYSPIKKKNRRRKVDFNEVELVCSLQVDKSHEDKDKDKKKKKKGFFARMFSKMGSKKKKDEHVDGTDSQDEEEQPKFIYSQDFAGNPDVYKKQFSSKDIISIFKRLAD